MRPDERQYCHGDAHQTDEEPHDREQSQGNTCSQQHRPRQQGLSPVRVTKVVGGGHGFSLDLVSLLCFLFVRLLLLPYPT